MHSGCSVLHGVRLGYCIVDGHGIFGVGFERSRYVITKRIDSFIAHNRKGEKGSNAGEKCWIGSGTTGENAR